MKIEKLKKFIYAVTSCVLLLFVALICFFNASRIYAAPQNYSPDSEDTESGITPYAVANLSLSISGGDGKAIATVKNTFTWYKSTVVVIVYLYSSDTYTESYTDMTMVSYNETGDLDMGKTIMTEAETGGVEKYWIARMRYKINSGDWQSKDTGVCRLSGSGEFLGYM